jgi:hypothetical protein
MNDTPLNLRVKSRRLFDLLRTGVYNKQFAVLYAVPSYDGDDCIYNLFIKGKLSNANAELMCSWVSGFIECFNVA